MKKTIFLLFTILNLFIGQTLFSQAYSPGQIDSIVSVAMSIRPNAGIAIAVVKDDKVVHLKGYGVTSIDSNEEVNENTLFAIASNSKAFTTAALAILVDEGKLNWFTGRPFGCQRLCDGRFGFFNRIFQFCKDFSLQFSLEDFWIACNLICFM